MSVTGLRRMQSLLRTREQIRLSCKARIHLFLGSTLKSRSLSDLTDVNIFTKNLDSGLFPGVSSDIWVHGGFADEHAKTASTILSSVKSLISSKGASTVICVSITALGNTPRTDKHAFPIGWAFSWRRSC